MSITGIGSDLVEIARIERLLAGFGARFEERVFTPREIAYARTQVRPASAYAARFAAKEAAAKALGTGLRGLSWRDIEVVKDALGKPVLHLPQPLRAHLSLSHDGGYALAFVVIEL